VRIPACYQLHSELPYLLIAMEFQPFICLEAPCREIHPFWTQDINRTVPDLDPSRRNAVPPGHRFNTSDAVFRYRAGTYDLGTTFMVQLGHDWAIDRREDVSLRYPFDGYIRNLILRPLI
jgi:hypothetical protein